MSITFLCFVMTTVELEVLPAPEKFANMGVHLAFTD